MKHQSNIIFQVILIIVVITILLLLFHFSTGDNSSSNDSYAAAAPGAVTNVTLKSTIGIEAGVIEQLIVAIVPANATNQTVTWYSNNTGVATVNASGLVTVISDGTVTISVRTEDGDCTDSCTVFVYPDFITTRNTNNIVTGSSNSNQIILPLDSDGTYNFYVS